VGCTLRRAGVLHIKPGCEKGGPEACPFLQKRSTLFRRLPDRLFVHLARPALLSSVLPADSSRFSFGNTAFQPAGRDEHWTGLGLDVIRPMPNFVETGLGLD